MELHWFILRSATMPLTIYVIRSINFSCVLYLHVYRPTHTETMNNPLAQFMAGRCNYTARVLKKKHVAELWDPVI